MKAFKHTIPALLLVLLAACSSMETTHLASPEDADGILIMREEAALRLASSGSGKGTLTLRGWQYPFEVSNMALSGVGPGNLQLEGDVYNVNEVSDFEGTYKITTAQTDAKKGAQEFWAENEKGVRVHIWAHGQDVTMRMNTGGAIVKLLN